MLFFGGIIYGFNALMPVLIKEGIYSDLCKSNTSCSEQYAMYGRAFTTYMVTQMVFLFVVGLLIDHVGLRVVKLCSAILFSMGAVIFAITTRERSWLIFPAGCFMCVGGMAGLLCNFSISKLFNKTSVIVLALITGSFDAGSSVFAVVTLCYSAGFPYTITFYILAAGCLSMNIFSSLFITTYRMADMSTISKQKTRKFELMVKSDGVSFRNAEKISLIAEKSIILVLIKCHAMKK